ncbi:hypothetical protein [Pseudomonas sp. LR-1a]|uniref:hypothetical protein n=1 Tax=Pseudomonas sp. LR-1a TaxID=3055783 RepID=UPI0035BED21F
MRPVMKSNPWRRRLEHIPTAGMLIFISLISTKPITLTGVAIALCTIPFLCLSIISISMRWSKRFGGSQLMNIIAILLLATLVAAIHFTASSLKPYIGDHFCQAKSPTIEKCFPTK